MEVIVLD